MQSTNFFFSFDFQFIHSTLLVCLQQRHFMLYRNGLPFHGFRHFIVPSNFNGKFMFVLILCSLCCFDMIVVSFIQFFHVLSYKCFMPLLQTFVPFPFGIQCHVHFFSFGFQLISPFRIFHMQSVFCIRLQLFHVFGQLHDF